MNKLSFFRVRSMVGGRGVAPRGPLGMHFIMEIARLVRDAARLLPIAGRCGCRSLFRNRLVIVRGL